MVSQEEILSNKIDTFIMETSVALSSSEAPHAFACVLPLPFHVECALACAKKILCLNGEGSDSCTACSGWVNKSHPDLFFLGKPDEPPTIEDCRRLWEELSLKPVVSNKRMGVLFAAHRLSLPAANSLLKITEETPSSGRVMLLMEEDFMLPTLRSRIRSFKFISRDHGELQHPTVPSDITAFIKWVGQTKKMSPKEILAEMEDWVLYFTSEKDFYRASSLDYICVLARKGKLTTPMIQDLALAGLEGEVQLEQLFDDFW